MTIRKTGNKYYWGSKGPFNSRKKAEEVAQAAHASGYERSIDKVHTLDGDIEKPDLPSTSATGHGHGTKWWPASTYHTASVENSLLKLMKEEEDDRAEEVAAKHREGDVHKWLAQAPLADSLDAYLDSDEENMHHEYVWRNAGIDDWAATADQNESYQDALQQNLGQMAKNTGGKITVYRGHHKDADKLGSPNTRHTPVSLAPSTAMRFRRASRGVAPGGTPMKDWHISSWDVPIKNIVAHGHTGESEMIVPKRALQNTQGTTQPITDFANSYLGGETPMEQALLKLMKAGTAGKDDPPDYGNQEWLQGIREGTIDPQDAGQAEVFSYPPYDEASGGATASHKGTQFASSKEKGPPSIPGKPSNVEFSPLAALYRRPEIHGIQNAMNVEKIGPLVGALVGAAARVIGGAALKTVGRAALGAAGKGLARGAVGAAGKLLPGVGGGGGGGGEAAPPEETEDPVDELQSAEYQHALDRTEMHKALLKIIKEGVGGDGGGAFDGLSGTVFTSSHAGIFTPNFGERGTKRKHRKNKRRNDHKRKKLMGEDKKNGLDRLVQFLQEGSPRLQKRQPDKMMTGQFQSIHADRRTPRKQIDWRKRKKEIHKELEKSPEEIDWKKRQEGISEDKDYPSRAGDTSALATASTYPGDSEGTWTGTKSVAKAPDWNKNNTTVQKQNIEKAGTHMSSILPLTRQNSPPGDQDLYTEKVPSKDLSQQVVDQNDFEKRVKAYDNKEKDSGIEQPQAAGAAASMANYPNANMQMMEKGWGSGPDTFDQDALHRGGDKDVSDIEEYEDEREDEREDNGWIPEEEDEVKAEKEWLDKFQLLHKGFVEGGNATPVLSAMMALDNE